MRRTVPGVWKRRKSKTSLVSLLFLRPTICVVTIALLPLHYERPPTLYRATTARALPVLPDPDAEIDEIFPHVLYLVVTQAIMALCIGAWAA